MATQAQLFSFSLTQAASAAMEGGVTALVPAGNGGGMPVAVPITDPGVDLARKTVCIKVRLSTMGNTRKVSTSQIETDADKDLLRVSKHLVDSAELKAIGRFDGEIRRFLYNICLPFEIGIHLLPITALETVEHRLRQFAEDRKQLVGAFIAAYPSLCQDAAKRLRGLYNPADYPPVEDVTKEFGGELRDGYFDPVIERNSVIPVSRVKRWMTIFSRISPTVSSMRFFTAGMAFRAATSAGLFSMTALAMSSTNLPNRSFLAVGALSHRSSTMAAVSP